MQFTIKAFAVLATVAAVCASPVNKDDGLQLTTQTFTFTDESIYETIVPEPPYWLTATTTIVWTQTQTNWVQATPTANA